MLTTLPLALCTAVIHSDGKQQNIPRFEPKGTGNNINKTLCSVVQIHVHKSAWKKDISSKTFLFLKSDRENKFFP